MKRHNYISKRKIRKYLDKAISEWRINRDEAKDGSIKKLMAIHYIDAFQSVRVSLLGRLLENRKTNPKKAYVPN